MSKTKKQKAIQIINRRAKFDYEIIEKFEAGIVLNGKDVHAIRDGQANITQAFAKIIEGEIYLINANFGGETHSRKLLLHKREIASISSQLKAKSLTLIPLKVYNKRHRFKVLLGLGKSKKKFQKKETIKKRDIEREIARGDA
jgi:SsrA-binding protein